MSLITVSALVNVDASFVFPPYGLPAKKKISVYKTSTVGQYQIIYDAVFRSTPVVTVTQAWLGWGNGDALTLDNATINEINKTYPTVKLGNAQGVGTWRAFTIVLTGPGKPEFDEEEAHDVSEALAKEALDRLGTVVYSMAPESLLIEPNT
ncbi:uncharacterized protein LACBIDRAFT_295234 [Laccaria bicolor S238N-H82]|uniref:Predicted protein n=1 Tax=Laccaria bicolor (strain S238N-H82 / ATCC MYA-4686) TaxID=486041 RepID=B0DPM7_LACBS|nr:uncharacterized protein LACBIDRAFT_295234 [Laccaria bicolor S238N-H82]EDR03403.1 predicted protein [Laccaria bicolor S238N-H82]|eukprot:XP_001885859.1 predicted protein [Laccaria bicolor S238N-H82]